MLLPARLVSLFRLPRSRPIDLSGFPGRTLSSFQRLRCRPIDAHSFPGHATCVNQLGSCRHIGADAFCGPAVNPSLGAWARHPCLAQSAESVDTAAPLSSETWSVLRRSRRDSAAPFVQTVAAMDGGPEPPGMDSRRVWTKGAVLARHLGSALKTRTGAGESAYLTTMPGVAPASGCSRKMSLPPGPAASTMPSETPKRILRGARLATHTVSRPTSSAGSG